MKESGNWSCHLKSYGTQIFSTQFIGTINAKSTQNKISQLGTYAIQITVACIFGITTLFGIISYLLLKYCS